MKKIEKLLGKYVKSINECNLELAREIWEMEESVIERFFSKRELQLKNLIVKHKEKFTNGL